MTAETILYIVIAGVISLGLTIFMYAYKAKIRKSLRWILGVLRFLTIFCVLLLLINPKFTSKTFTLEKPKLPVLIDNSASINALNQAESVSSFVSELRSNKELNDKFDISFFNFGVDFTQSDSLSFSEKNTNISSALLASQELFNTNNASTIVITDGNQTLGADYEFIISKNKNPIFPIIAGDSIKHTDLMIERLSSNRYAFLKNIFPVEVLLVYNGATSVNSRFVVTQGAATVYTENVSFSETNNTKTISFTLPATSVGLQKYTAQVLPLVDEKNTANNSKRFAVEVIDQATNILIVSAISHPDVGTLKKSIITNEQRKVDIKKPEDALQLLDNYQLIVLYQPDTGFSSLLTKANELNKNIFTITGLQTDWVFLNGNQTNYSKEVTNQTEDVSAALNPNYGTFAMDDIGFSDLPPLKTAFGDLSINTPNETLLDQTISGITNGSSLLSTMELNGRRFAILDGEGIWKWRAQSYVKSNNFVSFDEFLGKIVQYLASNKRRSRLEVTNKSFYYNNNSILLTAQYFDQNFVFDSRASLTIKVTETTTKKQNTLPLLLKNNYYEVNLSNLPEGSYTYTVSVVDEAVARSGNFTILNYNVEQQFLNANVTKLQRLATNTNGKYFFISENQNIIDNFIADESFKSIQKSEQKVVPLIDWKYLLALIILTLVAEWFIRKYNGLI